MHKSIRITFYAALLFAWFWALSALWYYDPWPEELRHAVALAWAGLVVFAFTFLVRSDAVILLGMTVLLVAGLWQFHDPSNERTWADSQARIPQVKWRGEQVEISNIRHATYRNAVDYNVQWSTRKYDLAALKSVDLILESYSAWSGLSHTFLSFGFDNGDYLAVSVEARREKGESYSPLKGMFRQYELMYVFGDERDLIGMRANIRKHPVYVYPIKADRRQARSMLESMLKRANELAQEPEFYHTLTNTCTSNIVRHLDKLSPEGVPFDYRIFLPGYADEVAYELDLLDVKGSLEEARGQYRINERSTYTADSRTWSSKIRDF